MSDELKVRFWIWGGFLSVLILLAVVGTVSYLSFEKTFSKFDESGRVGQSTVLVLQADRDVASMRITSRRYLATGTERFLKAYHDRKDSAIKGFQDARELIKMADQHQAIQRVIELLISFDSRFEEAVVQFQKKSALLKEINTIGLAAELALKDFADTSKGDTSVIEPFQTIMELRLESAQIYAEFNGDSAKLARESAAMLVSSLKKMADSHVGGGKLKLEKILNIAQDLQIAVEKYLAVSANLSNLTDEVMDAVGKEIYYTSVAIKKLQVERQKDLQGGAQEYVASAKITIGVLTAIALGIAIFSAILISAMVSRPIAAMAVSARVAEEIGELIKLAADEGDFRNRAATEGRTGFVATVSVAVNRLFDSICGSFSAISRDAKTVALVASDASSAVVEVNAGAAEQARSLEQVREAIRVSAEAITRVSGNASEALTVAEQAHELTTRGQITITEMADRVESSFRSNQQMVQISRLLGQSVTKVDIMAANAVVEAFRLGEVGRDFAAICQQVSALTKDAHQYAENICGLVEDTNRDLHAGSMAAGSARQLINDISRLVAKTDVMIRSIAETMLAQQSAIIEIDATTDSLTQIGEHNVEAGEQISRRLVELRDISKETQAALAKFKLEVDRMEPSEI